MEISALVVELESGTILDISAPRCRNRLHEIQHDPPGQVETHRGALPLDTHRGAAPQGQVDTHRGAAPWPDPHNHETLLHLVDLRTLRGP